MDPGGFSSNAFMDLYAITPSMITATTPLEAEPERAEKYEPVEVFQSMIEPESARDAENSLPATQMNGLGFVDNILEGRPIPQLETQYEHQYQDEQQQNVFSWLTVPKSPLSIECFSPASLDPIISGALPSANVTLNSLDSLKSVKPRARRQNIVLHKCTVVGCKRAFPLKSNLKKHRESVHLKLRPHRCTRCSRTFYERCKLRGHIATVHEGLRNFPCLFPGCSAAFKQNSDRKRHLREVHHGKPRW